jgi:hypothetical protein
MGAHGSAPACYQVGQQGDTMTQSEQSTPDVATARTTEVASPEELQFLFLLLVVAVLALLASFAPIPDGDERHVLNGDCVKSYRLGVTFAWKRVTHIRNPAVGRDEWVHDSFSGEQLAVYLAINSIVWGLIILLWVPVIRRWWRRRGVTRGVPAGVEQAALARWGPSASGPWAPSVCSPDSRLEPPPGATRPSGL